MLNNSQNWREVVEPRPLVQTLRTSQLDDVYVVFGLSVC